MLCFNLDTYDICVAANELKHKTFIGVNKMFMYICNNGSNEIKHFFTYCVFVYLCKAQFAIFVLQKNRREVGANDVLTLPDTILFQGTTSYYSIIV